MRDKQIDQLIQQMENFQECLKQFNHYVNLTRAKFTPEDETHFLETKSILVQELELILASIQNGTPTRDEVHSLISSAPSLRFVSQLQEAALRGLETQWHKIYIGWHSVLGQLKVKRMEMQTKSGWATLLEGKKK
jgi:hypothetical protein